MRYEVVPSRDVPNEWLMEAIDREGEGEVHSALFYGPEAQRRAEEYAAWKNDQAARIPAVATATQLLQRVEDVQDQLQAAVGPAPPAA